MLFMVVERFGRDPKAVYRRLRDEGRQMPEGLEFVDSWMAADFSRCFQLIRCEDPVLFQKWLAEWSDLGEFEVVPVSHGRETAAALADQLYQNLPAPLGGRTLARV